MSEKVKFEVARGIEGTSILYMNSWRISGTKPMCRVVPLYTFNVDEKVLINKILISNSNKLTQKDFTKYDNCYACTFKGVSITIKKLHEKLKRSKWILEMNKDETFISKVLATLTSCIDEIPLFLGLLR